MSRSSQYPTVRLERMIPAPPSEVYDAWLDPDTLRLWLAPSGLKVSQAEVDKCVGGRYRIWQTADGSNAGGFECEITEPIPDRRIVFRWGFVGPERTRGPVYDSLLTIHLEADNGMTRLTLVHEKLDALSAALPHVADQVVGGWESVLTKLVAMFDSRRRSLDA